VSYFARQYPEIVLLSESPASAVTQGK